MPYRHAPYYVLFVIAVIVAGFWPSYFGASGPIPWQFHAHGIAASLWVLMVLVQSWTVHKAQLPLHRAVGKSSLILFPFLIGGLAAIIDLTGKGFVAGDSPSRVTYGGQFLIGPGNERWDAAMLVEQSSPAAFIAFASNPEYLAGIGHRTAALEDSRLLPLEEFDWRGQA